MRQQARRLQLIPIAALCAVAMGFSPPPGAPNAHASEGDAIQEVYPSTGGPDDSAWMPADDVRIAIGVEGDVMALPRIFVRKMASSETLHRNDAPVRSGTIDPHGASLQPSVVKWMLADVKASAGNHALFHIDVFDTLGLGIAGSLQVYGRLSPEGSLELTPVYGTEGAPERSGRLLIVSAEPADLSPIRMGGEKGFAEAAASGGFRHRENYDLRPYPGSSLYPIQRGYVLVAVDPDGETVRYNRIDVAEAPSHEAENWNCNSETEYGYCTSWSAQEESAGGFCTYKGTSHGRNHDSGRKTPSLVYWGEAASSFRVGYELKQGVDHTFTLRVAVSSNGGAFSYEGFETNSTTFGRSNFDVHGYTAIGPEIDVWEERIYYQCGSEEGQYGDATVVQIPVGSVSPHYGSDVDEALLHSKEFESENYDFFRVNGHWADHLLWNNSTREKLLPGAVRTSGTANVYGTTIDLLAGYGPGTGSITYTTKTSATQYARWEYTGDYPAGTNPNDRIGFIAGLPGQSLMNSPMIKAGDIPTWRNQPCRMDPPEVDVVETGAPVPLPATGVSTGSPLASRPVALDEEIRNC